MNESDFDMLDESIRGEASEGLFKQITITLNPWSERHWIKKRFFEAPNPDVLAMTTTYLCNEWLDTADKQLFEDMKVRNPRRYQVAGLGNWGVVEGLVYENWRQERFTLDDVSELPLIAGLDYGYTNDPAAYVVGFIDKAQRRLFVWDEIYEKHLSNRMIYERILQKGYAKEKLVAEGAEPKSNDELRGYGLRVTGAKKGPDSIMFGIQFIQDYEIIIHPRCVNVINEISNYGFQTDRFGKKLNKPADGWDHALDALRYAVEPYMLESRRVYVNRNLSGGI